MFLKNLDKDERKVLYKSVKLNEFKKANKNNKSLNIVLLRETAKSLDRITKDELIQYVENHYKNDDDIINCFLDPFETGITYNFKSFATIKSYLEDKHVEELNEEDWEYLNQFKDEFVELSLKFPYEILIKMLCASDKNSVDDNQNDTKHVNEKEINTIKLEKSKLEEDNKRLKQEIKNIKSEHQKKNKEIEKELNHYKSIWSIKQVKGKLKNVLKSDFKGKSYMEIYKELDTLEQECLNASEYEKLEMIITAKYYVLYAMKGNIR